RHEQTRSRRRLSRRVSTVVRVGRGEAVAKRFSPRSYEEVPALRVVTSTDGMTADVFEFLCADGRRDAHRKWPRPRLNDAKTRPRGRGSERRSRMTEMRSAAKWQLSSARFQKQPFRRRPQCGHSNWSVRPLWRNANGFPPNSGNQSSAGFEPRCGVRVGGMVQPASGDRL
ncbi:hypothetical protein EOA30_14190, partial [Mesorhizobium sp. M8A.F.Ca.ET.059.01.1.1]